MRDNLRHYIDTSMNAEEAKYRLLGDGVESLTEEMNPEEETKHYIHISLIRNKICYVFRCFGTVGLLMPD